MEIEFTRWRLLLLISYFVGFAVLGGFHVPLDVPPRVLRSWSLLVLCFTVGAFLASVVDFWVGHLDRTNYRWFLIVLGLALMAFATLQLHVLHSAME